jgi:hypothetical protein
VRVFFELYVLKLGEVRDISSTIVDELNGDEGAALEFC